MVCIEPKPINRGSRLRDRRTRCAPQGSSEQASTSRRRGDLLGLAGLPGRARHGDVLASYSINAIACEYMTWTVGTLSSAVDGELEALPVDMRARFVHTPTRD